MYLIVFRKPHATISFAVGEPPDTFSVDQDTYVKMAHPRVTASWRVDERVSPVAVNCRLEPGEEWPADIILLPRIEWDGSTMITWLTTNRNYEKRDMLCDKAVVYKANQGNYAFCFSLVGLSVPGNMVNIKWHKQNNGG